MSVADRPTERCEDARHSDCRAPIHDQPATFQSSIAHWRRAPQRTVRWTELASQLCTGRDRRVVLAGQRGDTYRPAPRGEPAPRRSPRTLGACRAPLVVARLVVRCRVRRNRGRRGHFERSRPRRARSSGSGCAGRATPREGAAVSAQERRESLVRRVSFKHLARESYAGTFWGGAIQRRQRPRGLSRSATLSATFSPPPDHVAEFGKSTPLKRPGQPAEVAPAYVFWLPSKPATSRARCMR